MDITVIKMSYLFAGQFHHIAVKSDGKLYAAYLGGEAILGDFNTAQEAVSFAMEYLENLTEGVTYGEAR